MNEKKRTGTLSRGQKSEEDGGGEGMKLDQIGFWSEIKLEIIKKYDSAYTSIISRQDW